MLLRSILFAPANHRRHAEKALSGAADGVILDLEDAVAVPEKPAARAAALSLLDEPRPSRKVVFVRINGLDTPFSYDDLRAVVRDGLDGVVVPKVESVDQVAVVDWLLRQLEREGDLEEGTVTVVPIIETARGLREVEALAASSRRIGRLSFGAGDFTLDLGMPWEPQNPGVLWAKMKILVASRAAGLEPPLDTVYPDLRDADGFRRESLEAKRLGFQGKMCLHPSQVAIANEVFTPSREAIDQARRTVEAFDAALEQGTASIEVDGQFIDYPVAERARRVLSMAEALPERKPEDREVRGADSGDRTAS